MVPLTVTGPLAAGLVGTTVSVTVVPVPDICTQTCAECCKQDEMGRCTS